MPAGKFIRTWIWNWTSNMESSIKYSNVSHKKPFNLLIISWQMSLLYRNQSINLQSKSIDWFLYEGISVINELKQWLFLLFFLTCLLTASVMKGLNENSNVNNKVYVPNARDTAKNGTYSCFVCFPSWVEPFLTARFHTTLGTPFVMATLPPNDWILGF